MTGDESRSQEESGRAKAEATEDYRRQAYNFLAKSREYLRAGDLHQASEKGWGAASHMVKAYAAAQGLPYVTHRHFHVILTNLANETDDDRLRLLRGAANDLHGNFYEREIFLDARDIGLGLDRMDELLNLLGPYTRPESSRTAS